MRRFGWRPPRTPTQINTLAGHWRILLYPRKAGLPSVVEITTVRDLPVTLRGFSTTDPFGPKQASLALPQVSYFDRLGEGDLWWLVPFADIELRWVGTLPGAYPYGSLNVVNDTGYGGAHVPRLASITPSFSWFGRIESFDFDSKGLSLTLKGMGFTADDYLAKPAFPDAPVPYEWAIYAALLNHPHLMLKPLKMVWPQWWSTFYTPPPKATPNYLIPVGVVPHAPWTGLVTRDTGKWEPMLTSYIQGLLSAMYTSRGRWTFDIYAGVQPALVHRDIVHFPVADTVIIDPVHPHDISFSWDWSNSIGAVFGQGTSLAGNVYSGMHVTPDGMFTEYNPLSALRQVHPETDKNEWLDLTRARKEVLMQLQPGLTELQAQQVAAAHIARFGDPGKTGTVVVRSDPVYPDGSVLPKALIRAGMTMVIPNIGGKPEGLLAHITDSEVDLVAETNTLTFDTKWRDALTVSEVKLRGRDAMSVQRMLQVGVYEPPIPDQLVPWSYQEGSGYIPSYGTSLNSQRLFDGMPDDLEFPWEPWTTAHPPSASKYRRCYIRIGPRDTKADNNWAYVGGGGDTTRLAIPIRLAQAGQIRLIQIAAYRADGTVFPVRFHFSLWRFQVSVASMPRIPGGESYGPFRAGQYYPFSRTAWEKYNSDGTLTDPNIPQPATSGGLMRGWGDFYEKPGFWPGSEGNADPVTGIYQDESVWEFNLQDNLDQIDPRLPKAKQAGRFKGQGFLMLYCDEQLSEPVYFVGRMFRVEPGAQS